MVISRKNILKHLEDKAIIIEPFSHDCLDSFWYTCHLGDLYLDTNEGNRKLQSLPQSGLLVQPNTTILASTRERFGSSIAAISIYSLLSHARLGITVHISADFGHTGLAHCWTLEITCVQPVMLYPNTPICRVVFWQTQGDITLYKGNYTDYNIPCKNLRLGKSL